MPATGSERRRWQPRRTLRLRLTVLYGGLFLATGAVLLAITYGLVAQSIGSEFKFGPNGKMVVTRFSGSGAQLSTGPTDLPALPGGVAAWTAAPGTATQIQLLAQQQQKDIRAVTASAARQVNVQRAATLDALLTKSGLALGITALVSIGLGWLMAGRALRPVRTMSARARGISERNLHARLAVEGPSDELKELGDTFDGLLERLEGAFESQRRFVANASHELRTPITVSRTLVEVALSDPDACEATLRDTCERVLAVGEQQERLIEALLTLARSQRGLQSRERLDLGAVVGEVVHRVYPNGVRVSAELGAAPTTGDPALVERLAANLVENALHYNEPHGWVAVRTEVDCGRPTLRVTNTGPVVAEEDAVTLFEPFRRLDGERIGNRNGLGLGLSIVDAIARAHEADVRAQPRDGGGLDVSIAFPSAPG